MDAGNGAGIYAVGNAFADICNDRMRHSVFSKSWGLSVVDCRKVVHNQWLVTLQWLAHGFNHSAIGLHPGNLSNATTTGILVNRGSIATTQV